MWGMACVGPGGAQGRCVGRGEPAGLLSPERRYLFSQQTPGGPVLKQETLGMRRCRVHFCSSDFLPVTCEQLVVMDTL